MLTTYIMADGILLLKFNLDHYLMATNDKELRSAIDVIRTFMCVTARARAIELTSKIASINFSPHALFRYVASSKTSSSVVLINARLPGSLNAPKMAPI